MTREQECTHLLHTAIKQAEAKAKERNRELEHQLISARERAQTAEDKIVGLVSELRRASIKEHDWQGRLRKVEQERDAYTIRFAW